MTDRVGIVVVSHSAALADAAVALATEMVADDPGPIAVAAGTDDGGFGTDAMAVMAAIESVASPRGVLVVMDLGSAVLSTEMALEFLGEPAFPLRLTAAPLVEGLVAAVVQAALGADLDVVAREAAQALQAKTEQLADVVDDPRSNPDDDQAPDDEPDARAEVELVNADGLHARPAARVVAVAARADARVVLANVTTGAGPVDAGSLTGIAQLDARTGHLVEVRATGPDADAVVHQLVDLVAGGFGEDPPDPDESHADGQGVDASDPDQTGPGDADVHGIAPGRATGVVVRLPARAPLPPADARLDHEDHDDAIDRLQSAVRAVADHLQDLADGFDGATSDILGVDAAMARDPGLVDEAVRRVREEGSDPAAAVAASAGTILDTFAAAGGDLAERRRDVEDVRDRIVASLRDQPARALPRRDGPWVLVADDLAPADVAMSSRAGCVALVTRTGSSNSHTAIIARAEGLPALVVGALVDRLADDQVVRVDATEQRLVVDPDDGGSDDGGPDPDAA